jgi:hypothetical protein
VKRTIVRIAGHEKAQKAQILPEEDVIFVFSEPFCG